MIKIKDFLRGRFKQVNNRENHPVYMLLKANKGMAFRVDEISIRTEMNVNTIRSMIKHLVDEGLVVHKSPYYAFRK